MVLRAIFLGGVFIALFFYCFQAKAEPLAELKSGPVRIVLHNDPCESGATSNLPYKATYEQDGKSVSGCWGLNELRIVAFYFPSDKTVFGIPLQAFTKVVAI